MTASPDDAALRAIFARTRTIAVVGISKNEIRPSFYVARYLRLKGFRVIPVNPAYAGETLLGETVRPSLAAIPAEAGEIHMVDIFRRSADALAAPTYVEDKDSGELRRPHHIDLKTGMYKGRQVLAKKAED